MFALTSTLMALALAASAVAPPAPLPVAPAAPQQAQQAQAQAERQPIDVNTATAEDLQKIPGIGEALASRIVEFRQEHGPFQKIDDLLNVRGIGATSLEKLRPYLVVKKQG